MTAGALLYAPNGALRAPWRILAFLAVAAACALIVGAAIGPFDTALAATGVPMLDNAIVMCAGAGGATLVMLRWIDPRPSADAWLDHGAAKPRRWLEGYLLGAFAIGVPSVILLATGWLDIEPSVPGSWVGAAVRLSTLLLLAALAEELLFRGYLLTVLRETLGWAPGIGVTSVAFAYAHVANPGSSPRALAIVMLAGVFLGAVVVVTRSLYAAWMAHFSWNWMMAVVLHIPVSGLATETPDYRTVETGPDWATGGAWGPEGGAGAALGILGGIGYLMARHRRATHRNG